MSKRKEMFENTTYSREIDSFCTLTCEMNLVNIYFGWMNCLRRGRERKNGFTFFHSVMKEKRWTCHQHTYVQRVIKTNCAYLPAAGELVVVWKGLVLGAGTGTTEESKIRLGAGTGRLLPSVTRTHGEESSEGS